MAQTADLIQEGDNTQTPALTQITDNTQTPDMAHTTDIVCIGQAVIDCITKEPTGIPAMNAQEVAAAGKIRAKSISLATGGDALNEATALTGMGLCTRLVCGLGNDPAGHFLYTEAERRGIDISCVTVSEDMPTPVADIFVGGDGSRSSITSEASLLRGYRPDPAVLSGARAVSLASLFRAPLIDPDVITDLVKAAKEQGLLVFADTKLPTFQTLSLDDLGAALPFIDYIFPNETEAEWYSGRTDPDEMAEEFLKRGVRHVVIKMGARGCAAYSCDGEAYMLPAIKVPVVDTTGAGDHFVAGFIAATLRGAAFREACGAGLQSAAESISHIGA